jgi:hypothetical protein
MQNSKGKRFKDTKGRDVFILFDEASSYWMIAYDYTILDKNYHSYAEAADYIHQTGCKEWEDE